jgi:Fe-S oxidoreductase
VSHHSTFIAQLMELGRLALGEWSGGNVTYHDPCYLGRYNGEYEAPRKALKGIGIKVVEMERSGFRSRCCGGGGGAPITDIPGKRRIPDMRMEEINATKADIVAVGCPQCTAMLEGVVGPRPEVLDIAELVAAQLVAAPAPTRRAEKRVAEEVTA